MSLLCAIPPDLLAVCRLRGRRRRLPSAMSRASSCCWRRSRSPQVETVLVRRGDRVEAGQCWSQRWKAATRRLPSPRPRPALAHAGAQLADLKLGKRQEEIDVLTARDSRRAEAEAIAARAWTATHGSIRARHRHQGRLDRPRRGRDRRMPRSARPRPICRSRGCPPAPEAINAAEHQVKQAGAMLDQANWRLGKRDIQRRRPAASMTSSATPAMLPVRPRR